MKTILFLLTFFIISFAQTYQVETFMVRAFAMNGEEIIVNVTSELGGRQLISCIAVFESETKYRLVISQTKSMDIQKTNNGTVEIEKRRIER